MKMFRNLIVFFSALSATPEWADVEFKIVTESGFVAFAAAEEWPVVSMQPKMPVTASAFQIPNPADDGTPHSTNLAFMFYEHGSAQAARALRSVGKQLGTQKPSRENFLQWEVFRQEALQHATTYVVLDAKRELAGVTASVRLAWPRLLKNSVSYDADMKRLFETALRSVTEHVGEYVPAEGETVRRPSQ